MKANMKLLLIFIATGVLFVLLICIGSVRSYTIVDTVYVAPTPDSITVTMSWEEWERVKVLFVPVASVEDKEGAPTDTIFNYRDFIDTVSVWKDEYDTLFDWARDPDSDSVKYYDLQDTLDSEALYRIGERPIMSDDLPKGELHDTP